MMIGIDGGWSHATTMFLGCTLTLLLLLVLFVLVVVVFFHHQMTLIIGMIHMIRIMRNVDINRIVRDGHR